MVDTNSPEFQIGKKIGHLFMSYIGIRFILKSVKILIKSGRALSKSTAPMSIPQDIGHYLIKKVKNYGSINKLE